jgi:uncharacterized protein (UPF0335 family)
MSSDIKFCVLIDNKTILEVSERINEETIKDTVSKIEKSLLESGAKPKKIKDVFEISVEMLQNILNYSYGSRELENQKKEADGVFRVTYNSDGDLYTMTSTNLVSSEQAVVIQDKVESLKGLDDKEIRKLIREKMRSRENKHSKGAGLGLLVMAKKSSESIGVSFENVMSGIKKMFLSVTA